MPIIVGTVTVVFPVYVCGTYCTLCLQCSVETREHTATITEHEQRRVVQTGAVPEICYWQGMTSPAPSLHP